MRTARPIALSLILAAAATVVPLSAGTLYLPSPDYGPGAQAQTKIQIRNKASQLRPLKTTFVPSGQDGSAVASRETLFGAGKEFIFLAQNLMPSPGLLKLESPDDLSVVEAAVFLEPSGQGTNWKLPLLTPADLFVPGETAYLQGLERGTKTASRLEILNLGDAAASCSLRTLAAGGTLLAQWTEAGLPPLSHRAVRNVLERAGSPAVVAGARAEVACDQPFYAYGTVQPASALDLRLLYPLDAPPAAPSAPVQVTRAGTFFVGASGRPSYDLTVPLPKNVAYRRATIEFDLTVGPFAPVFSSLVGMYHAGGPRFGKTLYFGTFFRGDRRRVLIDQGSPVLEPAVKRNSTLQQGGAYKIRIVYDAQAARVSFQALRAGQVIFEAQGGAFNLDLADRGQPIQLRFGLPGVADSAYYPPYNWKFANLKVEFSR
jgi:hypothetical protein